MEAIQFNKETLVAVYGNCNAVGRKAIKEQLGERLSEILPVTDRVKTFNDAVEELGEEHEAVKAYRAVEWYLRNQMSDIKAYLQLRIITAALNEGWEPQFVKGEYRWYGWYDLISKEDYEALSDEEKGRCVGRSSYYAYANGGLVYSSANSASSYSATRISALGSPSKAKSWLSMQPNNSSKFTPISVSSPKLRTQRSRSNRSISSVEARSCRRASTKFQRYERKFKIRPAP